MAQNIKNERRPILEIRIFCDNTNATKTSNSKTQRNSANYYWKRYGYVKIQLNDTVVKGRINTNLIYFRMLNSVTDTVKFGAKVWMNMQMHS